MAVVGTIEKLEAEKLGEGVVVVRLSDPPGAGEWEWLLESVHRYTGHAGMVILRGRGWGASPVAELMAAQISQLLRTSRNVEVVIDITGM